MTPEQARKAIEALPLNQREVALELGLSYSHLRNTLSQGRPLGRPRTDGKPNAPEKLLLMLLKEYGLDA